MTTVNSPFTRQVLAALYSGTHFAVMPPPLCSVMPSPSTALFRHRARVVKLSSAPKACSGTNAGFLSFSKHRISGLSFETWFKTRAFLSRRQRIDAKLTRFKTGIMQAIRR